MPRRKKRPRNDEAFDGIAIANANAEKNLQNARAQFESHLQSIFTQCGEGWVETTYQQKLSALESLRKSQLHQAFTGEL